MESQQTALPKLYIGIDIHKRSWKVHCTTDLFCGKSFSMPPEPGQLLHYVLKHFPGFEVSTAYEAGCCVVVPRFRKTKHSCRLLIWII